MCSSSSFFSFRFRVLHLLRKPIGYSLFNITPCRCSSSFYSRCRSEVTSLARFSSVVTVLLFAWTGWCDVKERYLSVCVFFLYTVVLIFLLLSSFISTTSRKGSWLSVSYSTVNWIEGLIFKNSSQVDIVDLHSCPDDDRSMAIETVGIKFSLLKDNVRVGVVRSN